MDIPVIASLNGISDDGWLEYAREIAQAGADALELNVYYVAADPDVSGAVAYNRRYGLVAIRSVMMLGGLPAYFGRTGALVVPPRVETAAGDDWDSIAVVRYPRPLSLFMLESMPGYRAAVKHRRAGLERTALYICE